MFTHADFYTKVAMTRHNTTIKTRRTDVIKRDVAPKFNESFSFKMTTIALPTVLTEMLRSRDQTGLETNGLDLSRPNMSAGLKARIFVSTSIWRPQFRSRPVSVSRVWCRLN